jgi:uncharacterized protein (DUF305 family)
MKELSFVEKCVAKLKLDDKSLVELAADQIIKTYNKEIKVRERKIADLKAKQEEDLVDLNEQLGELKVEKKDIAVSINLDLIGSNEARRSYVSTYTKNLQSAIDKVMAKEKQIADYKSMVSKSIEAIEQEIAQFKALLVEMV